MPLLPAVFLDRDGTLNRQIIREGRPYPPATLEEFRLYEGVAQCCEQLKAAGFVLVVVTNQPDVGRGTQDRQIVESMHRHLQSLIPSIDLIQVCYHGGENHGQPCACRKPRPGMLISAAAHLGLDLSQSWMVGDRWRDVEAGHSAGCRTIFIDHSYAEPAPNPAPHFTVHSFEEATLAILQRQKLP